MVGARGDRKRWGVRQSSVVIAVGVVFLALLGGGALLVLILQSALASTAADETATRAAEIADLGSRSGLSQAVAEVRSDSRPAQLLQIIAPDQTVVAASRPGIDSRPLSSLRPVAGATDSSKTDIKDVGSTDDFLVAAQGFSVAGQTYVVQVAAPLQVQAQTIRTVAGFLLGATPVLLLVVGVAVWVLVGRALEPVEVIRRQVTQINGQQLSHRVAVPATRDEIAALAGTMNMMLDRLEASDRAQRSFVSDASHELRSPLSTVITAAEVSAADPTGALWRDRLETVLVESRRMRFLVDNLMTLAKADSHDLDLRTDDVDLDDVVETEVRQLREASPHLIGCAAPPTRVVGDHRRLTQVLRNLLENADRHARSRVDVSLVTDGSRVLLRVDNDGPLVAEPLRERIFERFVRLDDDRARDSGGSGLGLAITREIVHAHHGTVVATATEQGWCRFEVTLPHTCAGPDGSSLRLDSAPVPQDGASSEAGHEGSPAVGRNAS